MASLWFIYLITLICICATLKYLLSSNNNKKTSKLPPGPLNIPILSSLQWLRRSISDFEPILKNLHSKYGPIITLQIGHSKTIFIASSNLAHQALIQNGASFAARPPAPETSKFISSNQHNIVSSSYGSLWRLLRRNISYQILHPSKFKSYSPSRKRVLQTLINNLKTQSESCTLPILVGDHFQYAIFSLLVLMCFGEKLDEEKIKEIQSMLRALLLGFSRFDILNFFPRLGKILFKNLWRELYQLRSNLEDVLLPLIKARQESHVHQKNHQEDDQKSVDVVAYVDTLLNLELPDEGGRKFDEHEIVTLCIEILNAGTDTTATALQWIMANLVKHQDIQSKLVDEIKQVLALKSTDDDDNEIKEEDVEKMPYLKAVVLEGLRRHPPGHFLFPHAVTEDVNLDGYVIPKDATVNFMVAEIGWDPKLWKDPMEFKPERFLSGGEAGSEELFDITGTREIKMLPFGAGRRICPGVNLALLHLGYFVANLVREFEWTVGIGEEVDLSEKQEFFVVMKNPPFVHISPRRIK
ncbi:Cytochrome P450 [Macleaya cordata]|uniref:Cytochrome P450 n=1 Tax=Macleaya cordata TaxID=56857 RepID=A0A200Q4E0_MACCD|nr:Cytochrome P450 [Macleaya cordata]